MHIAINHKSGIPYASLMKSVRVDGHVRKEAVAYLGRVLDQERGIYKSKERGVFTYDLATNTYGDAPEDFVANVRRKNAKEQLLVDYGDVYLFESLIQNYGLGPVLESVPYANPDSFRALLLYYLLQRESNAHAECWHSGSYARILYPQANLSSQRISQMLASIGREDNLRAFFHAYLNWLGANVTDGANILIDSTGLPNSIRFPLTAISNHNGEISEQVRLIYVVQQRTRLPIYMRYVPGNIIDTTTLVTTIKELKAMGVNTKFAILDAGYVTDEGLKRLHEENISFLTRCPSNRKLYKELIDVELDDLEETGTLAVDENGRLFNGRQVFIKCVEVEHNGMKLYAYIGRDKAMQEQERVALLRQCADERINQAELRQKMREHGVFVLLASRRIQAAQILAHYYVRQDVEQVFDLSKNYASLLPLHVEKEETFRGHLLMTFIATVIMQKLQNDLRASEFSIDRVIMRMRTQKAKVFDNIVIPAEPVKEHNAIYKILKIKSVKEHTRKSSLSA